MGLLALVAALVLYFCEEGMLVFASLAALGFLVALGRTYFCVAQMKSIEERNSYLFAVPKQRKGRPR